MLKPVYIQFGKQHRDFQKCAVVRILNVITICDMDLEHTHIHAHMHAQRHTPVILFFILSLVYMHNLHPGANLLPGAKLHPGVNLHPLCSVAFICQ